MYKRATRSAVAPLVALSLAVMPGVSFAQNDNKSQDQGRTSSSTYNRSDMSHDAWAGYDAGRVKVVQTINDKGITQTELISILPLLQDLRDARTSCQAKHDAIYMDELLSRDKAAADTAWQDCQRMLADRQRDIWNTVSDRIGADKANALRDLAEPKTEDMSRVAYTNTRIQRIESMLQELDRMAAARIAANGGTPPDNTVRAASVETTTTTTQGTPIYVTTPGVVDDKELVRVVQDKIVANEIGSSDYAILVPMWRDLNSTDLTFLREGTMKVWW